MNIGTEYIIYSVDRNVIINPELNNRRYLHINNPRAIEIIKNRIITDGLVDVWRMNNPLIKDYTWFQVGSEKRARLEYFLTFSIVPDRGRNGTR